MPVVGGKGNRTRKTLSFFAVNFGLSPPYDVLCDGPIIFQSLKNDLYLKRSLPKLLGAPAYPVVTECVVRELRRLGDDFTNAAIFAKRVKRVPCVHDGKADVAECLLSHLRSPSHAAFVLATNDPEASQKAARVPGVAIVSILNQKKLILQAPSLATINYVKRSQKTKIHSLSDSDRALVQEVKAAEDSLRKGRIVRKKRKRAKGPNPLSVKKSRETDRRKADGTSDPSAMLEVFPPNSESGGDKREETAVEFVAREGVNTTPHEDTDSPNATSGTRKRQRKRRRVAKPSAERDPGLGDAGKGFERSRLSQHKDQSSGSGPRGVEEQSKQVGKLQDAMGAAIAGDVSLSASRVSPAQQGKGALPPTANGTGTEGRQSVHARERTPTKSNEASVLMDTHLKRQRHQEKEGNEVSFNKSASNANRDTGASGQIRTQLSGASHGGGESKEDSGAAQKEHADTNEGQLAVLHGTQPEEKPADKSPDATVSSGRPKKHRKNRRRRPKKTASN